MPDPPAPRTGKRWDQLNPLLVATGTQIFAVRTDATAKLFGSDITVPVDQRLVQHSAPMVYQRDRE